MSKGVKMFEKNYQENSSENLTIKENYDIKDSKIDMTKLDKPKKGVDALMSFKAIMQVVDKRRPYEPFDFVKETFIPQI